MQVRVQAQDFDVGQELARLYQAGAGAVVSFVGLVRDFSQHHAIEAITLEHYPAMTEKSLLTVAQQAHARWDIHDLTIIHRIGKLMAKEQIVLVAVSSAHRQQAFLACEYLMDHLKTQAPFWKKEYTKDTEYWVNAKASDDQAQQKWQQTEALHQRDKNRVGNGNES